LLFPAGFVIQVLQADLFPVQMLAFSAAIAAFVSLPPWRRGRAIRDLHQSTEIEMLTQRVSATS